MFWRSLIDFFFETKVLNIQPLVDFPKEEFNQLKHKARIAIVDDEDVPHAIRLRRDGYNIADFPDIDYIDSFLKNEYHIIILDIQGVGKKLDSTSDGWSILKYIKEKSPHTIVLLFTGVEWSLRYRDLADLSDDYLTKDIEFLNFKEKLDKAIEKAFSFKYHFEVEKKKFEKELSGKSIEEVQEILFTHGRDKEKAMREVRKISSNVNIMSLADNFLSISNSIIQLLT
jgi:DNA-binding NtrC family response regulator